MSRTRLDVIVNGLLKAGDLLRSTKVPAAIAGTICVCLKPTPWPLVWGLLIWFAMAFIVLLGLLMCCLAVRTRKDGA